MNKKSALISLSFAILILFAILLQSLHSYEHWASIKTEKKCKHNHNNNSAQINDSHIKSHHCFACEFTFSNVIKSETFNFYFNKNIGPVHYSFSYSKEITQSFRGSLFALRAPPVVV